VSQRNTQPASKLNFEQAMSSMGLISRDKFWLDASSSLCALLGYQLEELKKLTWEMLTHPEDISTEIQKFNRLACNKIDEYTITKRLLHKDGSVINVRQTARNLMWQAGTVGCIAVQIENIAPWKQVQAMLRHYESQAFMLTALIDTAHDPVMVVDVNSKFQFANASGHDLLNAANLMKLCDGKISFLKMQYQRILTKALSQAVNEKTPTEIVLPSDEQSQKWWMTVVPLRSANHLQTNLSIETAMIVLHDSSAKTHHIREYLQQGYGLKAAEIRLAEAVAKGMTPEDYATSADVQITTVRTQLRSIFQKTGTKRQSDLVRLMSDVPRVRRQVMEPLTTNSTHEPSEQDIPTISALTHRIHQMDVMDRITQMSLAHDEPEAMLRGVLDLVREHFDADRAGLLYPCDPDAPTWSSFMESTKSDWITPIPVGTITPMTPDVQKLFRQALTTDDVVVYDTASTNQIPDAVINKYLTKSQMLIALKPKIGKPWLFGLVNCTEGRHYTDEQQKLLLAIGQRLSDRLGVLTAAKQLRESKEKFHSLFQDAPVGIFHSNLEGKILIANLALAKMLAFTTSDELIAKSTDTQMFENSAQRDDMVNAMLISDDWVKRESPFRRKDGRVITVNITGRKVLNSDGGFEYFEEFIEDISQKKQSQELIWRQSNFDALTDLPNRVMFREWVQQEIIKANNTHNPLVLMLVDLDRFKEVNDTLGHYAGDILLKEAAKRISDCARGTDNVARLGGDEFTVMLTGEDAVDHADAVADCIIQSLSVPFQLGEEKAYISASIGITVYPTDCSDIGSMLRNADQAMYFAKDNGRSRYAHFTRSLQDTAQNRQRLITDLHTAISTNQFQVYFQPIVEMQTGHICKAEALVRWKHPDRGMVSPADFIPVAEETGMIIEIGDWVFKEAAKWSKRWNGMTQGGFQVSVNKSPIQMHAHVTNKQNDWVDYLHSVDMQGSHIAVEITEGLLLHAGVEVADELLRLRDYGVQVAIDDFGTGYSSLSYLNKLDIDYLKIDQSFVNQLSSDSSTMALPEAIIVMAHRLGLKVVAEGIETKEQYDFLLAAGCDYGQGYFFSRPVPPEDFEALFVVNELSLN